MGKLILFLPQVLGLIEAGITSFGAIKAAIAAGKTAVVGPDGETITTPEALRESIGLTRAAALEAGDAAAARIDARHAGDPPVD